VQRRPSDGVLISVLGFKIRLVKFHAIINQGTNIFHAPSTSSWAKIYRFWVNAGFDPQVPCGSTDWDNWRDRRLRFWVTDYL
jgi:hypothetical protein